MPVMSEKPRDLIGKKLRDEWRDLVKSPLPSRLRQLLDELERAERAPSQRPAPQKGVH
jgi:hypothetical protein